MLIMLLNLFITLKKFPSNIFLNFWSTPGVSLIWEEFILVFKYSKKPTIFKLAVRLRMSEASKNRDYQSIFFGRCRPSELKNC